jgi:sugar O-acyltransferase (sialic acid O-acetyltransferase NeuD family)
VTGGAFIVLGAGGHAKVVIDALLSAGRRVLCCYDDDPALAGREPVSGIAVAGPIDLALSRPRVGVLAVVAIGDNGARRRIARRWTGDFGVVAAPSAVVGRGVRIGPGSMILQSATVNIDAEIGSHVILNTACSVDHDCRIGDFVHVAPGCHLGGSVSVGEGAFLGIGARVLPGVRIGRRAVVGAGSVVTKDLPGGCTAVGVPARVIKMREEEHGVA